MSKTKKISLQENILIVDDNPTNLNLLSKILSDAGYKVRAAISSKIALKAVELALPDLILLDILMPEIDGYQVCEQLKKSSIHKNIPIIFISALNEVIDKVKAFSVGGVDYITKPFQAEEVLVRVENQLRIQRLSKQLLEQNMQLQDELLERQRTEQALRESEAKLQAILDNAPAVIYLKDLQSRYILVNHYFLNVLNLAPEQCIGKTNAEIVSLEIVEQIQANDKTVLQSKKPSQFEEQILLADGVHTYYSVKFPLCDQSGNPYAIGGISTDVSDRIRTEQALRESEERFRNAFDYAAIGMALMATDGRWLKVNRALCEITGYSEQELLATTFQTITHPDDLETDLAFINQLLTDQIRVYQVEKRYIHQQGYIVWVLVSASIVRDHQGQPLYFIAQIQDISDRKQSEALLKVSLKEKEVLLKEIHHRVKNNLQIVSSLLQMQTRRTQDSQTSLILQDSKNRISSIALVHEKLYRSDDLANIDFAQYIPDLTTHLFESYKVRLEQVTLYTQIDEIFLEIETAIPCGLIINELVSNSLKYAFPDNRKGEIYVEFYTNKDDTLTLIVRDDGIGIPEKLDIETATSLGLTLVQGLTEQLEGKLELDRSQGTQFKITFAAPKVAKVRKAPT